MYFYQQNFIYDVSSYPKTKNTTYNTITISNINISDLSYYLNTSIKPQALLSTGNFSPWGAKDVLLSDNWSILYNSATNTYTLGLYISNTDITSYDINQIKYLIFLDKVNNFIISSSDENFSYLLLRNNTFLRVKFNNNTIKSLFFPTNTSISKTSDYIFISSPNWRQITNINFNTNAVREIVLTNLIFPHFINMKLQRPSNTVSRVLRLRLILIDRNNTTHILETYYFSSFSGERLNTFNVVPIFSASLLELGSNSVAKLELAWTSDGNTLTTENTSIEIQCIWFWPANNFRIYF